MLTNIKKMSLATYADASKLRVVSVSIVSDSDVFFGMFEHNFIVFEISSDADSQNFYIACHKRLDANPLLCIFLILKNGDTPAYGVDDHEIWPTTWKKKKSEVLSHPLSLPVVKTLLHLNSIGSYNLLSDNCYHHAGRVFNMTLLRTQSQQNWPRYLSYWFFTLFVPERWRSWALYKSGNTIEYICASIVDKVDEQWKKIVEQWKKDLRQLIITISYAMKLAIILISIIIFSIFFIFTYLLFGSFT